MIPLAEFARATPFFVIAHRGSSGSAPENTLASLRLAVDEGARMIELDVQFTRDNEPVVFHDAVLGRTTDGHGYIRNKSVVELQSLDAGAWFSTEFTGERVPLFTEALDIIKNKAYLLIELKPLDAHTPLSDIDAVVGVVRSLDLGLYTLFASFDHSTIRHVKNVEPTFHTLALHVPGDKRLPSEVVRACGASAYGCSIAELDRAKSDDAKSNGIPFGVYTVNDEPDLRKAIELGVNAVVSNFPKRIMDVLPRIFTT